MMAHAMDGKDLLTNDPYKGGIVIAASTSFSGPRGLVRRSAELHWHDPSAQPLRVFLRHDVVQAFPRSGGKEGSGNDVIESAGA